MKRVVEFLAEPLGAYLFSLCSLFVYFYFIANDAFHLALTGAIFFGIPLMFGVAFVAMMIENAMDAIY